MKKLFLLIAVLAMTSIIASFTARTSEKIGSGYYFLYFQGEYTGDNNTAVKWVYISDIQYGERPNPSGLGASNYSNIKQKFINAVKSKYSSQQSKYYIDDMSYDYDEDKNDLIQKHSEKTERAGNNGYKVFKVIL